MSAAVTSLQETVDSNAAAMANRRMMTSVGVNAPPRQTPCLWQTRARRDDRCALSTICLPDRVSLHDRLCRKRGMERPSDVPLSAFSHRSLRCMSAPGRNPRRVLVWGLVAIALTVAASLGFVLVRTTMNATGGFGRRAEPTVTHDVVLERLREVAKLVATE